LRGIFGTNGTARHGQFKKYFSVQHPHKPIPSKTSHPNWKVDPFLRHLNNVFMEAVDLPECLSLDEQSMGFHGRSSNKMRIKFKKVGDGFQADCICSDGYTFSFYFRYQLSRELRHE